MKQLREPARILLVRNDRLGDLVLTLPAFEAVRRHWPEAHLAALVSPYAAPLIERCDMIDELLLDDPSHSAAQLGQRLSPFKFDTAIVFNSNARNCLAVWLARIRTRVGWAYKPAGMLLSTQRVFLYRNHPPIHEAEFALAFARKLGVRATLANLLPHLPVDSLVRERVAARIERELGAIGPLFGVHPGNKKSAYNWSPARYGELVERLSHFGRVMLTGAPEERPLLQEVCESLHDAARRRVASFTDFGLRELTAALSLPTALTVSSTGPMHIAGVLGTPVIALFSPHPAHVPAKWAPLGPRQTLFVAPLAPGEDPRIPPKRGDELMGRIPVAEVLAANLHYARERYSLPGVWKRAA